MKATLEINTTIDVLDQNQVDHIGGSYIVAVVLIPNEKEDIDALMNAVPDEGLIALLNPTGRDVLIGDAEEV